MTKAERIEHLKKDLNGYDKEIDYYKKQLEFFQKEKQRISDMIKYVEVKYND